LRKGLIIAVDGPAASGKGTIASVIARDYGLAFLDTGLLYRAVGYLGHSKGVSEPVGLAALSQDITTDLLQNHVLRGREAGERASRVAAIPEVRAALLKYQIDFAHQPLGAVLDGRDIATVIAPDAPIKLFITADPRVRAQRRWLQLSKNDPDLNVNDVLDDIIVRDARDQGRLDAPLVMAQDAYLLDTTNLGIDAAIDAARALVKERCEVLGLL
jgi:cytidylate kinase